VKQQTCKPTVLQVASSDLTVSKLLLPLIDELKANGYRVDAACSSGRFASQLTARGYNVHTLPMSRTMSPWKNLRSLWGLYRLIRKNRYQIVHVHTPIAAMVGRLAAMLAGTPITVYTAHGFYFHDQMSKWKAGLHIAAERIFGLFTDFLFTQSAEDAQTAVIKGIARDSRVACISNGVDLREFAPGKPDTELRQSLGIGSDELVVGYVGRLDREKGVLDLLEGMDVAARRVRRLVLLIVGDSASAGDRDKTTHRRLAEYADGGQARFRIVFTGWTDAVAAVMRLMHVFALPSYREGMPRSIIEAMATGLPVVATNIRGSREEVVHGETGYLVPVRDPATLGGALARVLSDLDLAREMGRKGRRRAEVYFDERKVLQRQVSLYASLVQEKIPQYAGVISPLP
jgi:glycosyltransferase involved in cell wall biosynthesis